MAARKGIPAGNAFVELFADDSHLRRGLRNAQRMLRAFGRSVQTIGRSLALIGGAGVAAFLTTIRAGADAQETLSKFQAVFGDQTESAEAFAQALSQDVGRSVTDVRDSMSAFQAFFKGLGFGGEQAREMSQTLQGLALDFASFNNLSDAEASQRFISALSGSSEVLAMFGINTKVAALEQELLSQGINKSWTEVTEQEKALARLNVIIGSMDQQGAIGDAIRTQASFANQLKRAGAGIKDMKEAISSALLPVLTPALKLFGALVGVFTQFAKDSPQVVAAIFLITTALTALGVVLAGIGLAMTILGGPVVAIFAGLATAAVVAAGVFGVVAKSWNLTLENMVDATTSFIQSTLRMFATFAKSVADMLGVIGVVDATASKMAIAGITAGLEASVAGAGADAKGKLKDVLDKFRISGAGSGAGGSGAGGSGTSLLGTFSGDRRQFYAGSMPPLKGIDSKMTDLVTEVRNLKTVVRNGLQIT